MVLNLVTEQKPKTILDVGIGYGKYGVLFREYLDIWNAWLKKNNEYTRLFLSLPATIQKYEPPVEK